jgi:hypothetical protein
MESKIRGNALNKFPNGKQFCFASESQGTRLASHWKTRVGARAFSGDEGSLLRDRYLNPPALDSGIIQSAL